MSANSDAAVYPTNELSIHYRRCGCPSQGLELTLICEKLTQAVTPSGPRMPQCYVFRPAEELLVKRQQAEWPPAGPLDGAEVPLI